MRKAPEAFRTISEAADALETPAHVLRFWESKFTQVKPVKRAGGRRYYRPADIDLLSGIKLLLHEQGMTIRGVQKLLQDKGARHVAALAPLSGGALVEGTATPVPTLLPHSAATESMIEPDPRKVAAGAAGSFVKDVVPEKAEENAAQADKQVGATASSDIAPAELAEPDIPQALDNTPEAVADGASALPQTSDDSSAPAAGASDSLPVEIVAKKDADPADTAPTKTAPTVPPNAGQVPQDTRPAPALAALLDAAADGHTAQPLRFATIAYALRTNPPKAPQAHANALARLEALVSKISARAD